MDIKTLCLGLLSSGEACGYDLKKTFESSFKHFFPAGYGSIYPALSDLAEAGLVRCREVSQPGKPDRKLYSITPAGEQVFLEVLKKAEPQHRMRSEFLATIYFAELMDQQRIEDLLDNSVESFRATAEQIRQVAEQFNGDAPAGARFVAGFGTEIARAAAKYIESNRHLLAANVVPNRRLPLHAVSGA